MWYQNDVLMEVIGRSLVVTFEGYWWVIGGHWRSLVKKMNKCVLDVGDAALTANHTKTCTEHENVSGQRRERSSQDFHGNPGDLNAL